MCELIGIVLGLVNFGLICFGFGLSAGEKDDSDSQG